MYLMLFYKLMVLNSLEKKRVGRQGGGIAVYVKDGIDATIVDSLNSMPLVEALWLKVNVGEPKTVLLCFLYRPPSSNNEYYDAMLEMINVSLSISDDAIMMGDLNFDYVIDKNLCNSPLTGY